MTKWDLSLGCKNGLTKNKTINVIHHVKRVKDKK